LARGFGLVWTAAHGWTVGWVALLLVQGLLPVATVYLTRAVVNNLAEGLGAASPGLAMGDVWASARPTLFFVALLAGIAVLSEILRGITGWIRTAQAELVKDHISGLIHAKANSLDLAFYETPEYYDRLFRARTDAAYRPVALLENVGSLAQNGLTLLAMAFSAWIKWRTAASAALFAIFIIPTAMGGIIGELFDTNIAHMLSLAMAFNGLSKHLLRLDWMDSFLSAGESCVVFAAYAALCLLMLSRRVRAYEVVS
jgi:hypothetical protein